MRNKRLILTLIVISTLLPGSSSFVLQSQAWGGGGGYMFDVKYFNIYTSQSVVYSYVTATFDITGIGFLPPTGYIERSANGGSSWTNAASFTPASGSNVVSVNVGGASGNIKFRVAQQTSAWGASSTDTVFVWIPSIEVTSVSTQFNGIKGYQPTDIRVHLSSSYTATKNFDLFFKIDSDYYADMNVWIDQSYPGTISGGSYSNPSTTYMDIDLPYGFFTGIRGSSPFGSDEARYALNAGEFKIVELLVKSGSSFNYEQQNPSIPFTVKKSNTVFTAALFEDQYVSSLNLIESGMTKTNLLSRIFVNQDVRICDFEGSGCGSTDKSVFELSGINFVFDTHEVDLPESGTVTKDDYYSWLDDDIENILDLPSDWDSTSSVKMLNPNNHGYDIYLGFVTIPNGIGVGGSAGGRRAFTVALNQEGIFSDQMKLSVPRALHEVFHIFQLDHPHDSNDNPLNGYLMGGIEFGGCASLWETQYWCVHPKTEVNLQQHKNQFEGTDIWNYYSLVYLGTDVLSSGLNHYQSFTFGNGRNIYSAARQNGGTIGYLFEESLKPDINNEITIGYWIRAYDDLSSSTYNRFINIILELNGNTIQTKTAYNRQNNDWIFVTTTFSNLNQNNLYTMKFDMYIPPYSGTFEYSYLGFSVAGLYGVGGLRFS